MEGCNIPREEDDLARDVVVGDEFDGVTQGNGEESDHSQEEESEELHIEYCQRRVLLR